MPVRASTTGEIEGAASVSELGLVPGAEHDQTAPLQAAIDAAAKRGAPLLLPPGRFRVGALQLPDGARLIGTARATTLIFIGGSQFLTSEGAGDIVVDGLVLDGGYRALEGADALLSLTNCRNVTLRGLEVTRSAANGIALTQCSGSLSDCTVTAAMETGIRSLDAGGLDILHNRVADCGNNGIQVWRSDAGEDASLIANNRIERIRADGGGTGQNGNGINVFRAAGVLVTGNRIADCAYSAIRGNAASNIQMIANSCARLGEVALYAEFGFEGALIANNLIDTAATGISVTNFNDGGRLAVVQGNLVRNLFRREQEPEDKRGDGITRGGRHRRHRQRHRGRAQRRAGDRLGAPHARGPGERQRDPQVARRHPRLRQSRRRRLPSRQQHDLRRRATAAYAPWTGQGSRPAPIWRTAIAATSACRSSATSRCERPLRSSGRRGRLPSLAMSGWRPRRRRATS